MKLKSVLRAVYRALPLKKTVINALRDNGVMRRVPMRYLRYLVFKGLFPVQIENGNFLMVNSYGLEIEAQIFWRGVDTFEPESISIWKKLSKRATYIFDVGANTGLYALLAQSINPVAKIYAFEPIKRVYAYLEENRRINRVNIPNYGIQCFQMALSDYTGEGVMYDMPVEHMYTASLNRNVHQERGQPMPAITEAVPVMRLDDFLQMHSIKEIDLIKIDVESHEPSVIRGMGRYLADFHPTIIVEIWNNEVGIEVEKALVGCSYCYFALEETRPKRMLHIANDQPARGYINYLICTESVADELNLT